MANPVSDEKAREILRHGEVHGHPLTERQRKFFGAIAGGAKVKAKNVPLFGDGSADPHVGKIAANWELGVPSDAMVGKQPDIRGDRGEVDWKPVDAAPIRDSDFPVDDTFSVGTRDALDTGGIV